MKKILYILFSICLFTACSSDDPLKIDENPTQDYTSFVIKNNASTGVYKNVVAGYRLTDNTLKRIATLGDISAGGSSAKTVIDNSILNVELFCNGRNADGTLGTTRPLGKINIEKLKNNIFTIPDNYIINETVDPTDPMQYPIK